MSAYIVIWLIAKMSAFFRGRCLLPPYCSFVLLKPFKSGEKFYSGITWAISSKNGEIFPQTVVLVTVFCVELVSTCKFIVGHP